MRRGGRRQTKGGYGHYSYAAVKCAYVSITMAIYTDSVLYTVGRVAAVKYTE